MNKIEIITLKALRKIYGKLFKPKSSTYDRGITDPDKASELIYNLLASGKPCMIARYGAFELASVINYIGVSNSRHSYLKYISGKAPQWWWNKRLMGFMQSNAGFFPSTESNLMRFGDLILEDSKLVDILGSWQKNELYLSSMLTEAKKIQLMYLDPFWSKKPWSRALDGKKVLVVHPFAESIKSQYEKRKYLFKVQDTLPDFKSLEVIKAIQSIGGDSNGYKDWFEALEYMMSEIDKHDYDVCLIGCGAYGFPLAAHVKRMGKQAIHMGGSLQLLFGIMGNRWDHDEPHYENGVFIYYAGLENEYWVRPSASERPKSHKVVENSCYW